MPSVKSSGSYRPEYILKVCVRCGTELKSFGTTLSCHPIIPFVSISHRVLLKPGMQTGTSRKKDLPARHFLISNVKPQPQFWSKMRTKFLPCYHNSGWFLTLPILPWQCLHFPMAHLQMNNSNTQGCQKGQWPVALIMAWHAWCSPVVTGELGCSWYNSPKFVTRA